MRKLSVTAIVIIAIMLLAVIAAPAAAKSNDCTTIKEGVLTYSAGHYLEGEPLKVGYDIFGYNYLKGREKKTPRSLKYFINFFHLPYFFDSISQNYFPIALILN